MKKEKLYFYIKVLSFIGIILAVYLLWQKFFQPAWRPCNINDQVNCDAIISGSVSTTFGISTPLIGLVGYVIIFISSFFRWKKILLGMAAFGLVFCLWIAYQELFLLRVICPVCISCQVVMTAVFILGIFVNKKGVK